jgi:hypothetical protein
MFGWHYLTSAGPLGRRSSIPKIPERIKVGLIIKDIAIFLLFQETHHAIGKG